MNSNEHEREAQRKRRKKDARHWDQDELMSQEHFAADDEDTSRHRRSNKTTASNLYQYVSILLALVLGTVWFSTRHSEVPLPPMPANPTPVPIAVQQTQQTQQTQQPSINRAEPAKPQPLADCIKAGNVIDEAVVNCSYGQHPIPQKNPNAQGMVSAQYMQKFKAGQQRVSASHSQFSEIQWVRQWDGKASYRAQWTVVDNQIDSSSVCTNLRRGSIEYRECRKGAKVWFKEQCRNNSLPPEKHQRYCSAASGFSPIG